MSSQSSPDEYTEPLGVRRANEPPAPDMEDTAEAPPPTGLEAADGDRSSAAKLPAAVSEEPDQIRVRTAAEDRESAPERDIAVATSPVPSGITDDGMPPNRRKNPILAAVAIGGALLLAVPVLLIGTGPHHGRKRQAAAAVSTVLSGGHRQPPPGAIVSAMPPSPPTPRPKPRPTRPPRQSAAPRAKKSAAAPEHHAAAGPKKTGFRGAADVLVKNGASGMCADIPAYGAGRDLGPVNQYHCALGDSDNQVWSLGVREGLTGPHGAPLFIIRNDKDNFCMDLTSRVGQRAGTKVQEAVCDSTKGDNQLWYRTPAGGGRYRIHNHASHGLCLGVTGHSHAPDARLEIHGCGSGDDWSFPSGT